MIEARVECLCAEFNLPDIHLQLRRGDVVWVAEDEARSSADLRMAVRSGAIAVLYTRRCAVHRSPPPPHVRLPRHTGKHFVPTSGVVRPVESPVAAPVAAAPTTVTIDHQSIEEAIARGVASAIQGLLASGAFVPAGSGGATVRGGNYGAPLVSTDDPVYLPSNLVPTDQGNMISVSETSSEGSDLNESAAALKAQRKRKSTS